MGSGLGEWVPPTPEMGFSCRQLGGGKPQQAVDRHARLGKTISVLFLDMTMLESWLLSVSFAHASYSPPKLHSSKLVSQPPVSFCYSSISLSLSLKSNYRPGWSLLFEGINKNLIACYCANYIAARSLPSSHKPSQFPHSFLFSSFLKNSHD